MAALAALRRGSAQMKRPATRHLMTKAMHRKISLNTDHRSSNNPHASRWAGRLEVGDSSAAGEQQLEPGTKVRSHPAEWSHT
mmetsp:Transcript_9580/g.21184  ORF Transcript_9580/g.21184 Transcript_9580/m.21184 type:complete len:82 (-) Transcript_9580:2-247(-)